MKKSKIALFLGLAAIFAILWSQGVQNYLTLDYLKNNLLQLQETVQSNTVLSMTAYFLVYVTLTAISFPGAALLTLLAGALFGVVYGTIIVSFASTIGATLAFLLSRYLFKDWVQTKFGSYLKTINNGLKNEGAFYLLSLRLIPALPFFVVNLVMGLTALPLRKYYLLSQIGMLPGTITYVYAGLELSKISSLKDLLSGSLILAFVILGLLPPVIQGVIKYFKTAKLYRGFKKPKTFDYNIISIGAGSAGLVTSYIGAAVKAKVALIEKHKMGGDCLNTGCVPSKALIKSARYINDLRNSKEYGVKDVSFNYSFGDVMARVHSVIRKIEPHDSIERYSSLGVDCITGEAKIMSPYHVQVNGKILTTKNIVIATGAGPSLPSFNGLSSVPHYTSDTLWNLTELPKRLLVMGGGAIGCELAQAFLLLGSAVTIVEMSSRILSKEDPDISDYIAKEFLKQKMHLKLETKVTQFEKRDDGNFAILEKNGVKEVLAFDVVLVALGRKANVKGFGLEELKIPLNENGTVKVDTYLRTNYPNIFACGDVAGPYQFTHAAAHQAWFAAVNALFSPFVKFKVDYRVMPWTTFVTPEVARVGLNETEAKAQNILHQVNVYHLNDLDRAIADSCDYGFIKVLTVEGSDKILGVTIVADHASELLTEFVTAMKYNLGLNKILGTIHAYPTVSEANKYVAGVWKKRNAPEKLLRFVEKFHRIRLS